MPLDGRALGTESHVEPDSPANSTSIPRFRGSSTLPRLHSKKLRLGYAILLLMAGRGYLARHRAAFSMLFG